MTVSRPVLPQVDELICFSLKSKRKGSRYGALVGGSELAVSDQQLSPHSTSKLRRYHAARKRDTGAALDGAAHDDGLAFASGIYMEQPDIFDVCCPDGLGQDGGSTCSFAACLSIRASRCHGMIASRFPSP